MIPGRFIRGPRPRHDGIGNPRAVLCGIAARGRLPAGGAPFVSALPLDEFADMTAQLIRDRGPTALQYCTGQGDEKLREQICGVMELSGIHAHPDDVVITTGSNGPGPHGPSVLQSR